jgi:hypothetical protein
MNHNFKPGDLAMIIGSNSGDSPNIWKSVLLLQRVGPGEVFTTPGGSHAKNGGPAAWLCEGDDLFAFSDLDGWIDAGGVALVLDKHLMPLAGDFQPEHQKAREAEPCA